MFIKLSITHWHLNTEADNIAIPIQIFSILSSIWQWLYPIARSHFASSMLFLCVSAWCNPTFVRSSIQTAAIFSISTQQEDILTYQSDMIVSNSPTLLN
jgi:hypothetical protein